MVEPLNTKAWVMVPVEPTPEMLATQGKSRPDLARTEQQRETAEMLNSNMRKMAAETWREMLAASPSLPVVDGGDIEAAERNRDAARTNFLTMQGAADKLRVRAEEAESRVLSLEEEVKRLRRLGDTLSSITFNLAQPSSPLTNDQKAVVREAVTQWDAGRAALKVNGNG